MGKLPKFKLQQSAGWTSLYYKYNINKILEGIAKNVRAAKPREIGEFKGQIQIFCQH